MSNAKPEIQVFGAEVSFTMEQLGKLHGDLVTEADFIRKAKELKKTADELKEGSLWGLDLLSDQLVSFLDTDSDDSHLKYGGKVLDLSEFDMEQFLTLETDHPLVADRELGRFDLDAINIGRELPLLGAVILTGSVRREEPSDMESEVESTFGFIMDPTLDAQAVEVHLMPADDNRVGPFQALLPKLAAA